LNKKKRAKANAKQSSLPEATKSPVLWNHLRFQAASSATAAAAAAAIAAAAAATAAAAAAAANAAAAAAILPGDGQHPDVILP
jgi:hypothetical protein